jgi:hypothetical protein
MLILSNACNNPIANHELELKNIIGQLEADKGHVFLRTLIPTFEDCLKVFASEEPAKKAFNYSEQRFADLDQLPVDAMKPVSENAKLEIQSATKEDLLAGIANKLEEGYLEMAKYLKDGEQVYGFHYLNTDGEVEKSRAAFFKAGKKWVFIPRTFMAFISKQE